MKKTHPIYKDYPELPYISPDRDLALWEAHPEKFHYGIVPKKNMIRLEEGILPGDLILLWRVHFNTFTTESVIPEYVEYRYGVDSVASIKLLLEKGFIFLQDARQSLDLLTTPQLKVILKKYQLPVKGAKAELLSQVLENLDEATLSKEFSVRRYAITPLGSDVLENHPDILKQHGSK